MNFHILIFAAYATTVALANQAIQPWQQEFLDLTNKAREKVGVPPIALDLKLNEAAHQFALVMHKTGELSHTAGGTQVPDRLREQGIKFRKWAENLATGNSVQEAFDQLNNCPHHRENIVDPDWTLMGIGGDSREKMPNGKWVQLFIRQGKRQQAEHNGQKQPGGQNQAGGQNQSYGQSENKGKESGNPKMDIKMTQGPTLQVHSFSTTN